MVKKTQGFNPLNCHKEKVLEDDTMIEEIKLVVTEEQ